MSDIVARLITNDLYERRLRAAEEIVRLRARVAELEKTLAEANEEADVRDGDGDTLVGQIKMYVQHRHYLASQNITHRKRVAELEAENAKLREAVTWRPIGDLKPSIGEYVLLSIHMMGKRTPELGYRDPLGIVRSNYRAVCDYATHWIPLPEAPR